MATAENDNNNLTNMNVEPKKAIRGLPEKVLPTKKIIMYVCPTEDCSNFFGSPSFMPEYGVEEMQHHRNQNDGEQVASHPRTECPVCREIKGIHVQRIPYIVTEMVPLNPILHAARAHVEATSVAL